MSGVSPRLLLTGGWVHRGAAWGCRRRRAHGDPVLGQQPAWPGGHSPRYLGQERNSSVYFLQGKKNIWKIFFFKLFRLKGI